VIIEFLPQAKSELTDVVAYYEGELSGLGQRFWDEVDGAHRVDRGKSRRTASTRRRISARELKDIPLLRFVCRSRRRDLDFGRGTWPYSSGILDQPTVNRQR
jgi:hypothetical protein